MHIDFLEPAHQRPVLFEIAAIFLVRRRSHAPKIAGRQGWLQQIGSVHGAAACRTRADYGVNFIDEENRALVVFELLDHLLDPFLEVPPVAGAGQKSAHVQAEHGGAG